jgi:dihydrofolate synthase/folylpolyglutamate synthase
VSKEFVVDFIDDNKDIIEKISPSFFELTVAMAFDYFRHEKIDIAVIEVGMGGRLDSTNVVNPLVSIITNIGHDHQQYLGDTLDKIAYEKAGIIKKGVPVIVGESNEVTKPVFIKKAQEQNVDLFFAEEEYSIPYSMLSTDEKQILNVEDSLGNILYKDLKLDLLGQYQLKNLKSVLHTVHILKNELEVPENAIFEGLANTISNTGIIGRFMTLDYNPRIICDAAHNKEGLTALFEQVKNIAYKKLHIIVGFVNDKNIEAIIQLFPKEADYYFTKADIPRSLHENDLEKIFNNNGYRGKCFESVAKSVEAARTNAVKDDFILICGSTFIVSDAIQFFR